jgi:DMSO/TMAO reductase YedYZ molybdopterin-dependent catalytic subunit
MIMKKNTKRLLSTASGAALLLAGCASNATVEQPSVQEEASVQNDYGITVTEAKTIEFAKVANVSGSFEFNQDVVSPSDEVFSIFGTALTGLCAAPSYALENNKGTATMYVNVKGDIRKAYSIDIKELAGEGKETTRISLCACSTGPASATGKITGVKLEDVIQMADLNDGVNAIKVVGSDGYGQVLPLSYALEKEALIVYKVNGMDVPSSTQFWIPETVAKYFTRDVVDIELLAAEEVPAIDSRADEYRAQINILNSADNAAIALGDTVTFEGYADDLGEPIAAIEFSMDGGETWTSYPTEKATTESWVYWYFNYTPKEVGTYRLTARAITAAGTVSPLESTVTFTVSELAGGEIA